MERDNHKSLLISNFNISTLAACFSNDTQFPVIGATAAPLGYNIRALLEGEAEYTLDEFDSAILWSEPNSVSTNFEELSRFSSVSFEQIQQEVDEYSSLILRLAERLKIVIVPTWVFPSPHSGASMLAMKTGIGVSNTLMRMNLRLADNLDRAANIVLLDAQRWLNAAGKKAFNPKLWYMAKIPFNNEVFVSAVKDIKSAINGITGRTKKLIIVDLDDTLWGGVVGEIGVENIRLGGHDYLGEAYVDFQRALKALKNRGMLLGIISKNEEDTAIDAIRRHPEMVLKLEDFAAWRINWEDKAQNIVDLVAEVNLGLDSVVFIDDNPAERSRVKSSLPEVFVPDWPKDPMLYKTVLQNLPRLDTAAITAEDLQRTRMYSEERQRQELRMTVDSLEDWLKNLNITVRIEHLNPMNLQRTVQLLNKTNQMNLTTRRLTDAELRSWAEQDGHQLWTVRVSDKFGDSGLTGIISTELVESRARIADFVLSCRVMGKRIEETMLYTAISDALSRGVEELYAEYIPTSSNKPCLAFFKNCGFENNGRNTFSWKLSHEYAMPSHIQAIA